MKYLQFTTENPLTPEILATIPDGEIFCAGITHDCEDELHMARTGKELRWVAKKGYANDWAMYVLFNYHITDNDVAETGDKVFDYCNISNVMPCTAEAYKLYRR